MAATEKGHRELIECYHSLLAKNLILTDDFFRTLVTHGVFTEPLVNDLKKLPPHERTAKLIELVMTRTATGFRKFVDVLEVTGHHFLSDCLREAENYEPIRDIDVHDLTHRLPFISKALKTDQQKQAVRQFFREAIQKEVVKHTWKGDIQTKEQLILSRQKQIEQLWQFEEEEKIREKSMQELQENYMQLQTYSDDLRRECKSLQKHIEDLHKKHREELKAQVDFNMANDRHLTRLNEKAEDAGAILDGLHSELKTTMDSDYQTKQAITEYQNLENNFGVFCSRYRELSSLVQHLRDERHYMSNQVAGVAISDDVDFKAEFRDYILKNEEDFHNLRIEISKLEEAISIKNKKIKDLEVAQKRLESGETIINQDMAQLVELQKVNDENKKQIIARDDKILAMEKQLKLLNDKFRFLESSLEESITNEQHLQDAAKAAQEDSKKAAASTTMPRPNLNCSENQRSRTPRDSSHKKDENRSDTPQKEIPGPPPPTQTKKAVKLRNKSFDVGNSNNAYLLKRNSQFRPIYIMDESGNDAVEDPSQPDKSVLPDPVQFKQAAAVATKLAAPSQPVSTNYSKRLAASKALKQSKGTGLPSTLLKTK